VSREGLLPPGGRTALPFRWHGMPVRENANAAPKRRPPVHPKVLIDSKEVLEAIRSLGCTGKWSRGGSGGLGPYWFAWRVMAPLPVSFVLLLLSSWSILGIPRIWTRISSFELRFPTVTTSYCNDKRENVENCRMNTYRL